MGGQKKTCANLFVIKRGENIKYLHQIDRKIVRVSTFKIISELTIQ